MAFKVDENGNPILDENGNKIPLEAPTPTPTGTGGEAQGSEALKRQIEDLKTQVAKLTASLDFAKSENQRIEAHKNEVISEKRDEVAKRKALESLHEGLSEEEVVSALKRAKDGDEAVDQQVRDIVKARLRDNEEEVVVPLREENQSLRLSIENFRSKLADALVKQEIIENAEKYGVKSDMFDYAMFKFKDRISVNQVGDKIYQKDGHETDGINWEHEFIKLKETNPTIFDKNKGSNANHSLSGDAIKNIVNPWKRDENGKQNFSEQLRIEAANPDLAKKLKEDAGVAV